MKKERYIRILFIIVVVGFTLMGTSEKVWAYTNAQVSDPVVRRMGKQLGWSDAAIKMEGGYITYQITGINDNRRVNTSYDGYPYGYTDNQNRLRRSLSSLICKQHMDRGGSRGNRCYILTYSNAPTCTTGGWIWVGCSDDVYSFYHYHTFKEQLVPDEEHRIDLSSHYGYYQDALGHDYNYSTWTYVDSNGVKNGMRYNKCNYCNAYTNLQYYCKVNAGTGIESVDGEDWYPAGGTVSLNATVKPGYTWNKWIWIGNGSSTNQQFTFTINKAYEFTALASANQYWIHFDANGGDGHMDDIAFVYDVPQILPWNTFIRNNGYGDSVFLGWHILPEARDVLYPDGGEIINATVENGAIVTLYAIWDDCPWIEVEDMYYPLEDARNGLITWEELIRHAKAYDRESGVDLPGGWDEEKGTLFTIIDYQPTDFTVFTSEGSVTETFQVVDSVGNMYKKMSTIYIVDTEPKVIKPIGTTRFIDEKYYYESYENGGLEEDSIWKTNPEYVSLIEKTFKNAKNKSPVN